MDDMILNVNTLPDPLFRLIQSEKVKVHEVNGIFTLIPIQDKSEKTSRLFGMFADGRLSTEKYLAQKQLDKGLEE